MRLLITGGAGYIGSVVAAAALRCGHHVVILDDLRAGNRAAIPAGSVFVPGGIGDPAALAEAFGTGTIDAVLHLAAEAAVEASMIDPAPYFAVNVRDSLVLLEAMRAAGTSRMIFSSTAAIYGEPIDVPIDEAHPHQPINAYGESKLMFERCLAWYGRAYGLRSITFRYFNAAGATGEHGEARSHESHLIPLAIDAALGRRPPLEIFGTDFPTPDGTCIRDYVHVADIAAAHLLALDHVDRLGVGTFNIGSDVGYSVREVVDAVGLIIGQRVPWVPSARRRGDPARLVAQSSAIRRQLGWAPVSSGLLSIVESASRWRLASAVQ